MKKISLFGLGATAVALTLAACSVGDTDKGTTEIATYDDLPECSANKDLSGVSLLGTKLYVEDDDAYYLCTEKGWVESDSSAVPEVIPTEFVVDSATVTGSAKLGGSFVRGAKVTLREMKIDPNTKEFVATGAEFADEVSSDRGAFVIPEVHLYYDYALVEVKGKFYDMKSGAISEEEVTLVALADLKENRQVDVNLMTTLEYARVQALVKEGYSVVAAKAQAEKEIWNAIGFAGEVDDSAAAMAALEILFRQNDEVEDFVKAVDAFVADVGKDGTWEDEDSKTAMADFAFNFLNNKLKDDENRVIYKEADLLRNLAKFGVDAPAFHTYLVKYWNMAYGLGGCAGDRDGAVVKNVVDASDSADAYFICKTFVDPSTGDGFGLWDVASDFERDTVGLGDDVIDGTIASGNIFPEYQYVYDSTGTGNGKPARWFPIKSVAMDNPDRELKDSIILIIGACTDYSDIRYSVQKVINEDLEDTTFYGCNKREWAKQAPNGAYIMELGSLCHEGVFDDAVKEVKVKDVTKYFHCDSTISKMVDPDGKVSYDTTWNWDNVTKEDKAYGLCDKKHQDMLGSTEKGKDADGHDAWFRCSYSKVDDVETFGWQGTSEENYINRTRTACDVSKIVDGYVCKDSTTMGTGKNKKTLYYDWRKADETEKNLGKVCNSKSEGDLAEYAKSKTETNYYQCKDMGAGFYMWSQIFSAVDYALLKDKITKSDHYEEVVATSVKDLSIVCSEKDADGCTSWREASEDELKFGIACTAIYNEGSAWVEKTTKTKAKVFKCSEYSLDLYDWAEVTSIPFAWTLVLAGDKMAKCVEGTEIPMTSFNCETWELATEVEIAAEKACTEYSMGESITYEDGKDYYCAQRLATTPYYTDDPAYYDVEKTISWFNVEGCPTEGKNCAVELVPVAE